MQRRCTHYRRYWRRLCSRKGLFLMRTWGIFGQYSIYYGEVTMQYGICGNIETAGLGRQAGFDYFEMTVGALLKPRRTKRLLRRLWNRCAPAGLPCPVLNVFVPGRTKDHRPEPPTGPAGGALRITTACHRAGDRGVRDRFGSGAAPGASRMALIAPPPGNRSSLSAVCLPRWPGAWGDHCGRAFEQGGMQRDEHGGRTRPAGARGRSSRHPAAGGRLSPAQRQ